MRHKQRTLRRREWLAGLAALGGLAITARTYRLSEQGHLTDRYTKAIEQLGSAKLKCPNKCPERTAVSRWDPVAAPALRGLTSSLAARM
jgi:hypothetical protein